MLAHHVRREGARHMVREVEPGTSHGAPADVAHKDRTRSNIAAHNPQAHVFNRSISVIGFCGDS